MRRHYLSVFRLSHYTRWVKSSYTSKHKRNVRSRQKAPNRVVGKYFVCRACSKKPSCYCLPESNLNLKGQDQSPCEVSADWLLKAGLRATKQLLITSEYYTNATTRNCSTRKAGFLLNHMQLMCLIISPLI